MEEFVDACKMHFDQGRPCMGLLDKTTQDNDKCVVSQTPVPRKLSKYCSKVVREKGVTSCLACLELEDYLEEEEKVTLEGKGSNVGDEWWMAEVKEDEKPELRPQEVLNHGNNVEEAKPWEDTADGLPEEDIMPVGDEDQDNEDDSLLAPKSDERNLRNASQETKEFMYSYYEENNKPGEAEIAEISERIGLPPLMVAKWFMNRRSKGRDKSRLKKKENNDRGEEAKCGKTVRRDAFKIHTSFHREGGDNERVCCDKCGKDFSNKNALHTHKKTVHEGKRPRWMTTPASCTICNTAFKNSIHLNRHKIKSHSTDKKYECKYCRKRFCSLPEMRSHEITHEEPQFKCSFCGKMVKNMSTLVFHEREHTGERPFVCDVCGKGFKASCSLTTHRKRVHKIVNVHPMAIPLEKSGRKKEKMNSKLLWNNTTHSVKRGENPVCIVMCALKAVRCNISARLIYSLV